MFQCCLCLSFCSMFSEHRIIHRFSEHWRTLKLFPYMCHFPYLVMKLNVRHHCRHLWLQALSPKHHAYSYRTANINSRVLCRDQFCCPIEWCWRSPWNVHALVLCPFCFHKIEDSLGSKTACFCCIQKSPVKLTADRISLRIIKCFSSRQNLCLFILIQHLFVKLQQSAGLCVWDWKWKNRQGNLHGIHFTVGKDEIKNKFKKSSSY